MAFFCGWLLYSSTHFDFPSPSDPPRLFSNQSQKDLRLLYLQAIEGSHSSLHVVMYGLSDLPLLKALRQKIGEHVPLTLYYDPSGSPELSKMLPPSTLHPVAGHDGLMHQKIVVIDEERVLIGSANLTAPSLKMHDNLLIGLSSRPIANFLKQHPPYSSASFKTMVGGQWIELWLLPDLKGDALGTLKKKLKGAQRSIQAALFTFTHPSLLDELLRAQRRGVDVTVAIDLHSALGASAKVVEALQKGGVKVLLSQGAQLLHHKFVLIDERTLFCGSANWTQAAFLKNSDCLVALHLLNPSQKKVMKRIWRKLESTARPPRAPRELAL